MDSSDRQWIGGRVGGSRFTVSLRMGGSCTCRHHSNSAFLGATGCITVMLCFWSNYEFGSGTVTMPNKIVKNIVQLDFHQWCSSDFHCGRVRISETWLLFVVS